ncbi:hypothetical protein C8T65DRAFT_237937 [Cerioporus squamosus]|nr:hypothetical protein C8T65DRAFT_237937 [Cerioporus squamosus]
MVDVLIVVVVVAIVVSRTVAVLVVVLVDVLVLVLVKVAVSETVVSRFAMVVTEEAATGAEGDGGVGSLSDEVTPEGTATGAEGAPEGADGVGAEGTGLEAGTDGADGVASGADSEGGETDGTSTRIGADTDGAVGDGALTDGALAEGAPVDGVAIEGSVREDAKTGGVAMARTAGAVGAEAGIDMGAPGTVAIEPTTMDVTVVVVNIGEVTVMVDVKSLQLSPQSSSSPSSASSRFAGIALEGRRGECGVQL